MKYLPFIFFSFIYSLSNLAFATNNEDLHIADWVLHNGKIYTVNEQQPWAEAMAIKNGKIVFIGSNEGVKQWADRQITEITDLKEQLVLPGLHDVHTHPLEAASPVGGTCLLDSQESNAENFITVLQQCAPRQIGTNWVMGGGHSLLTLLESQRTPIEILDEAIPHRPAVLVEETSHSVWVNSKALQTAGIDDNTPNPIGGVIVRDELNGKATGILLDSAGDLLLKTAWRPNETLKRLNYQGLLDAFLQLNEYGITSVGVGRTYWQREFQDAWFEAEKEGLMTVRAVLALWAYPSMNDDKQIEVLKALYRNNPEDLLKLSQIKVYSDGILINTTAAMLEPYLQVLKEVPSNVGLNYFTEQRLAKYISILGPRGFDFHIHAIGDRAVHESLNAIEAAQKNNARHRLTHLEIVNPQDIPRFKQLGVIADMQVSGDFANPDHWDENEYLIGDRYHNFIPLKDLHEAGAHITLSSDWDVSSLNPFIGMQNALTRKPQNLPNIAEVIKAYTLNGAYTLRQETLTGSLEVGKFADFIILNQNLFTIPIKQIQQTKVLMTVLNGRIVYEY